MWFKIGLLTPKVCHTAKILLLSAGNSNLQARSLN